ncbi:TonB-dependent receptor [Shewanella avicenniae]|uniref:TonB-dependent receptor n=1 Tax=Shewanella avicenniae TaxID=2814294 RepID=A0ABX7QMY3_9GAMM|nr:TonB-dependent receptor [Shewanella avicenniae]QSX32263.1 TonB-dependent receptor [Shewanella avicenniae]
MNKVFIPTLLASAIVQAFAIPVFANDVAADGQNNLPDTGVIEHMVVSSDFRETRVDQLPASVTVIGQQRIEDQGAEHFEDMINNIANFNWSGGSSRPRYFQIRGVGEQEEYKGAPNSSVGFIIDDIDLSGLGMVSSMYDLQQFEVLRGPQGTRYGANALAGLIYLKSNDPTDTPEHGLEFSVGDDELRTLSGFSSGPLSDKLLYRLAVQQHQQNGYMDNSYLNRDDTNQRDELSARLKLRWFASDNLQVDTTLMFADFDNGYDAWTLDNNGDTSLSDQPGKDNQKTTGASIKITYDGFAAAKFVSLTSFTNSDHGYSFDGDWANPEYWASLDCDGEACEYDYFWDQQGERKTLSQELRLSSKEAGKIFGGSTDWLLGAYLMNLSEDNDLYSEYNGWPDEVLVSQYDADNYAVFGQLDTAFSAGYSLSLGARVERRSSDYSDTNNDNFDPSETMWGGHIALTKQLSDTQDAYIRLARGYKAGGFNMTLPATLSNKKEFDTEILYNYEVGLKSYWLEGAANTRLSVFYMDRQDQQVAASLQNPDDPQRFILFTENAGSSKNYGAEFEGNWAASDSLELYGSVGYLRAEYGDYQYQDKYGANVDLTGRELAHSPHWTYSLGASWHSDLGWFANLNASGKSKFYYSDSNDSQSKPYSIINAKLGYDAESWALYLWGRNLTDKQYGVRGFYFGNEPDQGWADKQYIRYGDPRQLGITLQLRFM